MEHFILMWQERQAMVESGQHKLTNVQSDAAIKRRLSDDDVDTVAPKVMKKRGPKKGSKRSKTESSTSISDPFKFFDDFQNGAVVLDAVPLTTSGRKPKDFSIQEISPFENAQTFKCQFCSKRSQYQEKIERHLLEDHPNRDKNEPGFKVMTRDQVVDLVTNSSSSRDGQQTNQFACYYCEVRSFFSFPNYYLCFNQKD